jgi:hypothetical protein
MKSKRIFLICASIFILAVVILYPWNRVVVMPPIRVRIVDEMGHPVSNAVVQQKWEYQCIGSVEHREISAADQNGYASFPERTERISLARLVPSAAREILYLPHGYGFGSDVTIWAYGDDPHVWYYVPLGRYEISRGAFPQQIRLQRNEEIRYPNDSKWP